jgi:LCP family protein required for cell wall assembly
VSPAGPTPPGLPPGAWRGAPRPSRRAVFFRRVVLANVFVFTFTACGVAYGYWFANSEVDKIQRLSVDVAKVTGGKPVNFLLIGSDSRSFVKTKTQATEFGSAQTESGQRSDTIMIARIDPKTKKTLLVSIPRDLWVDIPGHGHAKINAAFNHGAQSVIDTIKANFGVTINHYLEVNFAGFQGIVNAIGTVHLFFPTIARDTYTGLFVQHPGCVAVTGKQALAYVRSRHYQYKTDYRGSWHDDPTGDLGRIRRQQYFMRSLAQEAISKGVRNPFTAKSLVDQVVKYLVADRGFSTSDFQTLAAAFRDTDPGALQMTTLPSDPGSSPDGRQSILQLRTSTAAPIIAALRGTKVAPKGVVTVPARDPSSVTVRVLNGSGVTGAAGVTKDALVALGFASGGAGNASQSDLATTEVHASGSDLEAGRLVAAYLGGIPVVSDSSVSAASVVVVVGRDRPDVHDPHTVGATSSSTSSTVAPNPGSTPGVTVPLTERGRPLVGCA